MTADEKNATDAHADRLMQAEKLLRKAGYAPGGRRPLVPARGVAWRVMDAEIRVRLLGIKLATIDARVVTPGVDPHLRYAEAVNRLDLQPAQKPKGLPELLEEGIEGTAKVVAALTAKKKQLSRPAERVEQAVEKVTGGGDENRDEDREDRGVPASRRAPSRR